MVRFQPIQTNVTAGELSPRLYGRPDLSRFFNGLRRMRNCVAFPHGGGSARPGFRFVAEVKDSSKDTVGWPFVFSEIQAYAIEVGENYFRFFKDEAQILDSIGNKQFTNGDFATDISGWTVRDAGTGASTFSSGALQLAGSGAGNEARAYQQLTELGVNTYTVTLDVGSTTVTYRVGTTIGGSELTSGTLTAGTGKTFNFTTTTQNKVYVEFANTATGTVDNVVLSLVTSVPFELYHPWTEAQLRDLKFTQSADVLYITGGGTPYKMSRTGHTSWTIEPIVFVDGPWLDLNTSTTTISTSATTGTVTLTASTDLFTSNDVGRLVRLKHSGKWGSAKITGFTNATTVTAEVQDSLNSLRKFYGTAATADWRLGAWSDSLGWPTVVSFHEERLFFGNTLDQPQTVWGSVTGDFETFSPTLFDDAAANDQVRSDAAVTYAIATDQVNAIRWMKSLSRGLVIGTFGAVHLLAASTLSEALTPDNVNVTRQTSVGSSTKAVLVNTVILFVQRALRKLHEFSYSFENDGFTAPDLTLLSEHITLSGISDIAYAQEPHNLIWMARNDGKLIGLTYQREQQVVAFSLSTIGGTDAKVKSVLSIPAPDETHDQLWAVNERTINGATKKYMEFMEDFFVADDTATNQTEDCFFVDSGLTYDGAAATVISGLSHLEGQTVDILADGADHPSKTVSSGQITLDRAAEKVHVGLGYRKLIETMDLEGGDQKTTTQGARKRIHAARVRVHETLGLKIGPDENNLREVSFRSPQDNMDAPPPLKSTILKEIFDGTYADEATMVFVQDSPLPMTILSVMPEYTASQ